MADIIQLRRDTAANWVTANPVLADGEIGIETDTRKRKCGDGTTAWNSLSYMFSDDLDQEPTANSHKPVESDGVFGAIRNNGKGAFDISAYKAVGGVFAKFDDLAQALGTNGANVPAAARKPGMSVCFVLNSDNKYVQYRLMSAAWSTTVAEWQGIDDVPTAGSDNLVKSGGVALNTDFLEEEIINTSNLSQGNHYFEKSVKAGTSYKIEYSSGKIMVASLRSLQETSQPIETFYPSNGDIITFNQDGAFIKVYVSSNSDIDFKVTSLNSPIGLFKDLNDVHLNTEIYKKNADLSITSASTVQVYVPIENTNNSRYSVNVFNASSVCNLVKIIVYISSNNYVIYDYTDFSKPFIFEAVTCKNINLRVLGDNIIGSGTLSFEVQYAIKASTSERVLNLENEYIDINEDLSETRNNIGTINTELFPSETTERISVKNSDNYIYLNTVFKANSNYSLRLSSAGGEITKYTLIAFRDSSSNIIKDRIAENEVVNFYLPYQPLKMRIVVKQNDIITPGFLDVIISCFEDSKLVGQLKAVQENDKRNARHINDLYRKPIKIKDVTKNNRCDDRPQNALVTFKSFKPMIDYRGRVCFTGFNSDGSAFDPTSTLLFEEAKLLNTFSNGKTATYLSYSLNEDFVRYESPFRYERENFYFLSSVYGSGASDKGLALAMQTVMTNSSTKMASLFWSLDGGKTYEPAVNNYRAHVDIPIENIPSSGSMSIDDYTYYFTSASTISTYLQTISGETNTEKRENAKSYLADKIIVTSEADDRARHLAYHLIEAGYKVRITDTHLVIYSKVTGSVGNGESNIVIGGSNIVFENGEDYTQVQLATLSNTNFVDAENFKYGNTNINLTSLDYNQIQNAIEIDNKWYITFGYFNEANSVMRSFLLVLADITDLSQYEYKTLYNGGDSQYCEAIVTYDKYYDIMFIGMRAQTYATPLIYYSFDKGDNINSLYLENLGYFNARYNIKVIPAYSPKRYGTHPVNQGYDYPLNPTIYVICLYDRYSATVLTSTSFIPTNFKKEDFHTLDFSEFLPLNSYSDDDFYPEIANFQNQRIRIYNEGIASVGSMEYSRIEQGILVGFIGLKIINDKGNPTFSIGIAKEPC